MERPTVLIVEPDPSQRRELGRCLAETGYEAVPAVSLEEGLRFADGLGPAVVVARREILPEADGGEAHARLTRANREGTLVLLGSPASEAETPEEVIWLPYAGEVTDGLVGRLRLVLLGRQIGVEPDSRLEALVGELALDPPLEVIRSLARAGFTGRFEVEAGQVVLERGRVVAAAAGTTQGLKAFCRLGRLLEGVFRVWPETPGRRAVEDREIEAAVDDLVLRAVEDASAGEFPHPRTRIRVEMGPTFFASHFTHRQQDLLTAVHQGAVTVGALLDAFPQPDGELLGDLTSLAESGALTLEPPVSAVTVVTDSTADLPLDAAHRLGIEVVPLTVCFGEQCFADGTELRPRRFYELLESGGAHPSTEPPPEEDFLGVYRRLLPQRDVVSLHISSKLSKTFDHAAEAAAAARGELDHRPGGEEVRLEVVDSGLTSLGLGLLAVFAARMARRGVAPPEIAERSRDLAGRFQVLFVVDTLEFLARGGRIGRARAWWGELLRVKPILGMEGGEVVPVDRVRGGRAAHPRILELLRQRLDPDRPVVVGLAHARAPVWADRLGRLLEESFPVRERLQTEIGPVVGTHAGPGTVGAAVIQLDPEEWELLAPLPEGGEAAGETGTDAKRPGEE
jgi:DegV family protein with EDD domain